MKMQKWEKGKTAVISVLLVISILTGIITPSFADTPESQDWTGWLIDYDCAGANPNTHTQNCNLMPSCIESGEGIYVYTSGKAYSTYGAADWIPFDQESQTLAAQLNQILSDPNNHRAYLSKYLNKIPTIKVTGYTVTTGLPDNITDYAAGIHITSIEFYYISGVSNYEVTAPENVVLHENTPAPTVTAAPTSTPTDTSTPTPTPTSTPTAPGTPTSINIVLPTGTNTPTFIPTPPQTPSVSPSQISAFISGTKNVVLINQEFSLKFGLRDFTPGIISTLTGGITAQDISIHYNKDVFELGDIASLSEGISILKKDVSHPGNIRLILAGTGPENSVKSDSYILDIKFKAKTFSIPDSFTITYAALADGSGKEFSALPHSYTVGSLLIPYDINGDTRVSVGDLAIAGYNYRKTAASPDWETVRLADADGNGIIDVLDLALIAGQIE